MCFGPLITVCKSCILWTLCIQWLFNSPPTPSLRSDKTAHNAAHLNAASFCGDWQCGGRKLQPPTPLLSCLGSSVPARTSPRTTRSLNRSNQSCMLIMIAETPCPEQVPSAVCCQLSSSSAALTSRTKSIDQHASRAKMFDFSPCWAANLLRPKRQRFIHSQAGKSSTKNSPPGKFNLTDFAVKLAVEKKSQGPNRNCPEWKYFRWPPLCSIFWAYLSQWEIFLQWHQPDFFFV